MGRQVFMRRYPIRDEIISDNDNSLADKDLVRVSREYTLRSCSGSWRDTDSDWEVEQEEESKQEAIINYFNIDKSELDRFEIISLGRISYHSSSVALCSTSENLYLVLDKNTKIGYYLVHEYTMFQECMYS